MKKTSYSILAASILLATQVHAAGFQVVEHSASGLGRAFSGDGAIGDNASEISANPASMMLFDRAQFSFAGSIINPEIDVKNTATGENGNNIAPTAFVPALYYVNPINDKWAWGVGLYTDYGLETEYSSNFQAGALAGETSLITFKLNPNVAYRINDHFSLGAGLNVTYAKADLKRRKGILSMNPLIGGSLSDRLIELEGETYGWGWNVGALFELDQNNRFSVAYKSKVKLEFEDDDFTDGTGGITGRLNQDVDADLDIDLPAIVEIAAFHQITPKWAVHYSWQWTDYSSFTEIKATGSACFNPAQQNPPGTCFVKEEDFDDNQRWAIGTTYNIDDQWTVRAGFAYDEQAAEPTASIPDTDRFWYTAGLTYQWTNNLSLDAGFAYLHGKDQDFTEEGVKFESEGSAYITSMQLNYSF
ncbi:MAG: porin [Vibrio sp.]